MFKIENSRVSLEGKSAMQTVGKCFCKRDDIEAKHH